MVVVRRILQSSEGLERPTVEFLAEEEAVGPPLVGLALDRWRRAGRLRSEPGPDGVDLLFWTESPAPGARLDPASGEAEV
jgi:hypothetical protein